MQSANNGDRDAQPVRRSPAEAAFERRRRAAGVLLAPLAFAVVYMTSGGLGRRARRWPRSSPPSCVLWVSETLPLPVTALLGAVLCVVLGVAPAKAGARVLRRPDRLPVHRQLHARPRDDAPRARPADRAGVPLDPLDRRAARRACWRGWGSSRRSSRCG